MEALTWSERFVTGMPLVDEQHQRLFVLTDAFSKLCANHAEVPRADLHAVVDELARYAQTHFADEEGLMVAAGVDHRFVEAHRGQHARFLRDVAHMRASRFLDAPETTRVLLRFLLHWLAFHILGADMQLARQVERLQRGEPAAQAFVAEVREVEGPAQLLLGALDDLMRVLAQRNGELTAANLTLETRVAQRTQELSATVDALRTTQVKLVESEKLASVGLLASGLSHEINNPLAFIHSNLGALGDHARALLAVADAALALPLPPPLRATLDHAAESADLDFVREDLGPLLSETQDGVKRVQAIVQDLKDFTHVDGGAMVELELATCVQSTLKVLPAARRDGVRLVTELGPSPRVRCHAAQVGQALLNLVLNATQAVKDRGGAPGTVTVRTGQEGDGVYLEVADTGVGMSAEVLSHVFEPFFTTRAPGQGTGLGLTTAYNCAEAHGGRIAGASEPGVGSTFRLWLPLEGPRMAAAGGLSNAFNTRRYA
jgi:hemerythrin-like metal-binding protein